jgi:hypothetical protein
MGVLRWGIWAKGGSTKRASAVANPPPLKLRRTGAMADKSSCLKTSKVVEKLRKIWENVWKSEKNV